MMNNDFISRQAAIDICLQYCLDDDGTCSKNGDDLRNMLDEIETLPIVDAVPVVRCEDCRWYYEDFYGCHRCENDGVPRESDWFCADGKRRE